MKIFKTITENYKMLFREIKDIKNMERYTMFMDQMTQYF